MPQKTIDELLSHSRFLEIAVGLPRQAKTVLLSIINAATTRQSFFTSEVLGEYEKLCSSLGFRKLTDRRIGQIISEFERTGLIKTHVVSLGRHGLMREISPTPRKDTLEELRGRLSASLEAESRRARAAAASN